MAPITAYVGLGANLDDPVQHVRRAGEGLSSLPSTRVLALSPLYRSAPLGPRDQPDYINAVAALSTGLSALELLAALREVEARHGRRRDGTRWGPRTLDLDILVYGDLTLQSPALTLPHPALHERGFVLYPLYDVAPDLEIPGRGSVRALRERLGHVHITRLG